MKKVLKKIKGFTLIELLAVIVILGLLILVIIPVVSDIINNAKKDTFEKSVISLIKIAESNYSDQISEDIPETTTYRFVDGVQTEGPELKFTGSIPKNGTIIVQKNGKIQLELDNGKTCIIKAFEDDNTTTRTLENEEICEIPKFLPDNENITYIYDLPGMVENATPCETNGLDFTHILDKRDNKTYAVTKIGNQCWFAENLAYTGSGCLVSGGTVWNDTAPFNACDVNGGTGWDQDEVMYQWGAAMAGDDGLSGDPVQGLCPVGWVIPNDNEWTTLTDYLSANSQYWCGGVSTQTGKALASTTNWNASATACAVGNDQSLNNSTGFNGKPAGFRGSSGSLSSVGGGGLLWSSSPSGSDAWRRLLYSIDSTFYRSTVSQALGTSVRCLLGP